MPAGCQQLEWQGYLSTDAAAVRCSMCQAQSLVAVLFLLKAHEMLPAVLSARVPLSSCTFSTSLPPPLFGIPLAVDPRCRQTDLVKNQLADTARVRGMTVEQVVEKVLLADQPTKQFVKPEDLAAMVVHLCGPNSASITGACLSIDGGWTAR